MKLLMLMAGVMAVPTFAASGGDLNANDYVGVSFWLVTAALLAATAFFFIERAQSMFQQILARCGRTCGQNH